MKEFFLFVHFLAPLLVVMSHASPLALVKIGQLFSNLQLLVVVLRANVIRINV
jgi:hypothetical protein